ncbi:hypothetical protein, partial [Anaerosporobacter sp.]
SNIKKSNRKNSAGKTVKVRAKISTKGVTDADQLTAIKLYNAYVDELKTNTALLAEEQEKYNGYVKETPRTKLNNNIAAYDDKIGWKQNEQQDVLNKIAEIEAKGGQVTKDLYDSLIGYQNDELAYWKKEKDLAIAAAASEKEKNGYSTYWYELQDIIQGAQDEISGINVSIKENEQLINELSWNAFDKGITKVDKMQEELDSLSDLIDEDNLTLTDSDDNFLGLSDDGLAKMSLLQLGLASSTEEVKALQAEINKLNKQYANGEVNEANYTSRLDSLNSQLRTAVSQTNSYKSAIQDLVTVIKDGEIDALNNKLDAYKELIDVQKKALDNEESLRKYEDSISDNTKDREKIQNRINELTRAANSGDREAQNELKDLQDELAKNQKELDDLQYDRKIELQQDALDESYDEYEKMINNQIDALEDYYDNQEQLILDAANLTEDKFTEVYNNLLELAKSNNISISTDLKTNLESMMSQLGLTSSYTSDSLIANGNTSTSSGNNSDSSTLKKQLRAIMDSGTGSKTSSSDLNKYIKGTLGGKNISYAQMVQMAKLLGVSGISSSKDVEGNDSNKNKILKALKKIGKFKTGGIAKIDNPNPLLQSLTGEHGFGLIQNGEGLVSPSDTLIMKDLFANLPSINNLVRLT